MCGCQRGISETGRYDNPIGNDVIVIDFLILPPCLDSDIVAQQVTE